MKILFVTTISNTVNAFLIPHIKMLRDHGHQVDVAFNIVQDVKPEILEMGCKVHNIEFQRSPVSRKNISAYKRLKNLIISEKYDLISTHTPVASACVRLACRNMKNVKVVYTAHGFHFYKGAPLKNWLLYYPVEKWLSKFTDILITINKEDYERAKSSFKAKRIEYVPGVGLDTKKIQEVVIDKQAKRKELGVPEDAFLLLSVGELNINKNHETVIKAIAKLKNPDIFYVICGQGPLESYLKKLIFDMNLDNQVKLLGFRKDIIEICKASDIFVFPSFREGLSVALMEAMACGLPVVCSDIRGNRDLIKDGHGGFLINPGNVEGYGDSIQKFYNKCSLIDLFGKFNRKYVQHLELQNVIEEMEKVYLEGCNAKGIT
ncbi:glycosyltransferase family 4 protein [Calidifontibacillus erzurumensis]|uniref:Glycosyltransferase family 4 protein n=1 Tax=Calidifontibacillus erzurumensis TaxID=2741433 RepID=A0A8J8KC69_9BACI|nr:glycosyltransferase family 4 protein [Calidifontibacillus erzurumensis]NSL52734.1 glycosyltransferase family 4 protein [Calidifontibacillus erzurumensis]